MRRYSLGNVDNPGLARHGSEAMTYARRMVEAAPGPSDLGAVEVAAAIDVCADAAQACVSCADACLAEEDVTALRVCIGLDLDCSDVCGAVARVLSRQTRYDAILVQRLLDACVRACDSCAEECARHASHHEHCRICAEACRACARTSSRAMR